MGALNSNRKRGDGYFFKLPFSHWFNRVGARIFKKLKTSSVSMQSTPESHRNSASRVYRYPEPVNRIRREVHAPCRVSRSGFRSSSVLSRDRESGDWGEEGSVDEMGNVFSYGKLSDRYDRRKKEAVESLRYLKKDDKEVIDVDEAVDRAYVSGDSSVEEVFEVVDDERSQEENGKVVVSDTKNANWTEKLLESLSLDRKWDGPVHKRLHENAGKRDTKLKSLSSSIETTEKAWATLKLLHPANKPQDEDVLRALVREAFVPLTEEEEAKVSWAFSNSSRRNVLATHEYSNIEITGELLQCLRPGAWLNDEVINVYLELLKEREKREPEKFLKCHFFNTFFYKKLIGGKNGYDFKSVRRWTSQRKLGYCLLECDKIFVPIHKDIHWCLAVINKKDEKFQYLDSLKGIDTQVLKVLARYFVDEVKDKSGEDIDVRSWKQEYVEDLPEQKNGSDCGMFMIKYVDFYSRGLGLHFKQEHMPYFRRRTAKEILRLKAE
ncbi:hypothetical protein Vadar_022344 [Vaccinium darrowii]|uniref:Uncharacterized protein n=1 Tax=Vaccinium darrowii TaxID=229202 RepID=A0ACB7YXE3_9ERIC|nr:hypothetical protein Vadar_022344 [Vaccinium darrowii]